MRWAKAFGPSSSVTVVLQGASTDCSGSSPILVKTEIGTTTLVLEDGTVNRVADGTAYTSLDSQGEPDATIFSKSDLFKPSKTYQSVGFTSPALARSSTYDVTTGGSSSGTVTDGLCVGGTCTGGTKYTSFTISSLVTRIGSGGGPPSPP